MSRFVDMTRSPGWHCYIFQINAGGQITHDLSTKLSHTS